LAKGLHVPAPRVSDIVFERRGISADTAIRVFQFFETTEQFWLNLQGAYEIVASRQNMQAKSNASNPDLQTHPVRLHHDLL
jgi:addiction module HigA family antidote